MMKPRFVSHREIDRLKWDACLDADANSLVFQRSWYLDAVCDVWHALVVGDYEIIMPLPTGRRLSIQYLFQPIFSRQLQVSGASVTETVEAEFLQSLHHHHRFLAFGFHKSEVSLPEGVTAEEVRHQQLLLHEDYAALRTGYSSNGKRNAKKAEKAGLTVREGGDPEALVKLFQSTKGGELKALGDEQYSRLLKLMNAALDRDAGQCLMVINELGEVLAQGFFLREGETITYLKGAASDEGKKLGAMHLLFDYGIRSWSAAGLKKLDFGGSKVQSVAKFYKNFGADDAFYLFLSSDRLPAWARFLKKLRGK